MNGLVILLVLILTVIVLLQEIIRRVRSAFNAYNAFYTVCAVVLGGTCIYYIYILATHRSIVVSW